MQVIGVILCSKSKQNYICSVRKMYNCSVLFRAREKFMDLAYPEWYVNTSKYGFMSPDLIIEPYDSWYISKTSKNSQLKNNPNILTRGMIDTWLDKLRIQFPDTTDIELHCHLSSHYVNELKKVFQNIVYIKPQVSFTSTAWKYVDACQMYKNGATLEECNKFISEKTPRQRPPETKKWFYHMDDREFYGNAYDMSKTFSEVDNGCIYGLSMGTIKMSHGWVIDKLLLPYVSKQNNRYRLPKGMNKVNRDGQRMNIDKVLMSI